MNKNNILITGAAIIILAAGATQFLVPRPAVSPITSVPTATSTTTENGSSVVTSNQDGDTSIVSVKTVAEPFSLEKGDVISSWSFKSAYTDNASLIAKAEESIARLSAQLETATSSAMIISVGIANQYELLGNGEKQYKYLIRAIQIDPNNGLPWHNLGVLMERLGAYKTARVAYEKSTLVQPGFKFYHYSYIEFLTSRMGNNTSAIEKAFAFAEKNIGKTQYLIDLRTEWEKS